MVVTFLFNVSVIAAMVIFPLLSPQTLPKTIRQVKLLPPFPKLARPQRVQPVQAARPSPTVARLNPLTAPPQIATTIQVVKDEAPPQVGVSSMSDPNGSRMGAEGGLFQTVGAGSLPVPMVRVEPKKEREHVSGGVMAGQLLTKTSPLYPAIARAAGVQGTVVLHAVISKTGTIEGLTVVSGAEMLRAAAVDAVRQWRYRPYLLSGQPTEVDTTITVNFTMGGQG